MRRSDFEALGEAAPAGAILGVRTPDLEVKEALLLSNPAVFFTVPAAATLTFWVYEGTNDTISYVDQEADVLSPSGSQLAQIYREAKSTGGWVEKTFAMNAYAGQTVQLYFGVEGNGYSKDYVYECVDDVSLIGSSATSPPSAPPSAPPTATPSSAPFACNNG